MTRILDRLARMGRMMASWRGGSSAPIPDRRPPAPVSGFRAALAVCGVALVGIAAVAGGAPSPDGPPAEGAFASGADRAGRVRFSHERHARFMLPCGTCHRPVAQAGEPGPLDFERVSEAACVCHRIERAGPAVAADAAPAAGGTAFRSAKHARRAPTISHPTRGREDCVMCHAPSGGMRPAPADHGRYANTACRNCHSRPGRERPRDDSPEPAPPAEPAVEPTEPAVEPAVEPGPAAAGPPPVPHGLDGMSECSACHGLGGMRPFPANHEAYDNATCTMCHAAPPAPEPGPPAPAPIAAVPLVPHAVEGLDDCLFCHGSGGLRPVPASHDGRPNESCLLCHSSRPPAPPRAAGEPDPPACAMCHPVDAAGRVALPETTARPRALAFRHSRHEAASGAPCAACHTLAQADSGGNPDMRTCMTCHQDAARAGCARCHLHDGRGGLVTNLPDGRRLVPAAWMGDIAHDDGFDREHGRVARAADASCRQCHGEQFCQGCHLGVAGDRRFHGAGWFSMHGPSSRTSDLDCGTCHRRQDSCLACHRRAGVAADSPAAAGAGGSRYHPEAWVTWDESDAGMHSREARRNIGSCVACHSETDCLRCHATINPHGRGFGARCDRLRRRSPGACSPCHGASIPACPP